MILKFIPSIELIKDAEKRGYAVPSFCVWSAETMKNVLDCAAELRAPVMIMSGWAEFAVMEPEYMSLVAHSLIERYSVPVALHLDHGTSIDEVKKCLSAGYTSVMLDYSLKPFRENSMALKEVVGLARPLGVTVEGEIGAVGMVDSTLVEGGRIATLTRVEDAVAFAEETGVDILAISIGNSHGVYRTLPELDFDLLEKIRSAVDVPLVLHGGSGTPEKDLKKAISLGIAKINVASELVNSMRDTLVEQWNAGKNKWLPLAFEPALGAMREVLRKWIKKTGAEGKA
jgi:tagatose 1,6-diphosphate aldolase GatY/KbaY